MAGYQLLLQLPAESVVHYYIKLHLDYKKDRVKLTRSFLLSYLTSCPLISSNNAYKAPYKLISFLYLVASGVP